MTLRYLVIGAGNGGYAMAAELALLQHDVILFDFPAFEDRLAPLRAAGGIVVESRIDHFPGGPGIHFAPLTRYSTDIAVVAEADVIIVVVPGQHQEKVIAAALSHLRPGQLVLLNPGGVGGALIWAAALQAAGIQGVMLAQPADLLYAGYRTNDGKVVVADKKKKAALGIFPNNQRGAVMERLEAMFPEFQAVAHVLEAGMGGPGMLVHPLPMLMNSVRIDREIPFKYDAYDITPSVAKAVERLDAERVAIIAALGGRPAPIKDVLTEYYGVIGADFYDTVQKVPAYQNAAAPSDFGHRYISEEIPTQMVPSASIGRQLGLATPVMDATNHLASAITGEDYATNGWTAAKLGLDKLDLAGILSLLECGRA